MEQRRWAIRTVHNGRVKIFGNWYEPDDEYHNELEGQRFAFGLYWIGDRREPFVSLWGPEQNYHEQDTDKWIKSPCEREDRFLHWVWWREI